MKPPECLCGKRGIAIVVIGIVFGAAVSAGIVYTIFEMQMPKYPFQISGHGYILYYDINVKGANIPVPATAASSVNRPYFQGFEDGFTEWSGITAYTVRYYDGVRSGRFVGLSGTRTVTASLNSGNGMQVNGTVSDNLTASITIFMFGERAWSAANGYVAFQVSANWSDGGINQTATVTIQILNSSAQYTPGANEYCYNITSGSLGRYWAGYQIMNLRYYLGLANTTFGTSAYATTPFNITKMSLIVNNYAYGVELDDIMIQTYPNSAKAGIWKDAISGNIINSWQVQVTYHAQIDTTLIPDSSTFGAIIVINTTIMNTPVLNMITDIFNINNLVFVGGSASGAANGIIHLLPDDSTILGAYLVYNFGATVNAYAQLSDQSYATSQQLLALNPSFTGANWTIPVNMTYP